MFTTRRVATVGFQVGGSVVDRLRPGERIEEVDSVAITALQLGLERIVDEISRGQRGQRYWLKGRDWAARLLGEDSRHPRVCSLRVPSKPG